MFLNLKKAPVFVLLAPAVHTQITVHKGPFRNPLRLLCCLIVTYRSAVGPTLGRGSGWTVLDAQRSLWAETKTAHRYPWRPRWTAPQVALWTSALSRFSSHFARLNGYLDSGFLVRIKRLPRALSRARRSGRKARRLGCRGTLRGEEHLACGSPPSSGTRRCTGRLGRAPHRWG